MFVLVWSAEWIFLIVGVLFTSRLTTLRRCAGEQAISVVVVIKTMVAVAIVVFKFGLYRWDI